MQYFPSSSLPPSPLISSTTGNLVSYLAPHANVIHKTYRNTGSYTRIVFKNGLVDALLRVYSQKSPQVTWQNLSSFSLMAQFHETVAPLFIFNHFPVECPSFYSNFSHDMWSYISLYIYLDAFISMRLIPRSKTADWKGTYIFNFNRYWQIAFQKGCNNSQSYTIILLI